MIKRSNEVSALNHSPMGSAWFGCVVFSSESVYDYSLNPAL